MCSQWLPESSIIIVSGSQKTLADSNDEDSAFASSSHAFSGGVIDWHTTQNTQLPADDSIVWILCNDSDYYSHIGHVPSQHVNLWCRHLKDINPDRKFSIPRNRDDRSS